MNILGQAALVAAGLAASAAVQAKVLHFSSFPFNQAFVTATAAPLAGSQAAPTRLIALQVVQAGRYQLTFSAECAVVAPSAGYLDIDIRVNGAAVSPTHEANNVFCIANGTPVLDGWERGSIGVAVDLLAGTNTIEVVFTPTNGATGGWIGDTALVVHG